MSTLENKIGREEHKGDPEVLGMKLGNARISEKHKEAHTLAFDALCEHCSVITRCEIGEELITKLEEALGRFTTQMEDTTAAGLPDVAMEYKARLNWFNRILGRAKAAKQLHAEALLLQTPQEREAIAQRILRLSNRFAHYMKLVHETGNAQCAMRIDRHLQWFQEVMNAALQKRAIVHSNVN